ncbi:hypothetical protein GCM10023257_58070 [Streptomyces hyderabadensis]|uniref:Uncharacterized protein n=1 Tax=Streptomyces hyderabadensis TaxID=598549 RepID=A0ABP9IQQ0_9ACTN
MTEVMPRLAEIEADVQGLVEAHMETLLGVRFLASEYSTGPVHRLFGSDLLGFETVASVSGGMQVARRAGRRAAADVQGASMRELAGAVDEVLLGLGTARTGWSARPTGPISDCGTSPACAAAAQQAGGLPEGRPERRRPCSGLHPGRVWSRSPRDG